MEEVMLRAHYVIGSVGMASNLLLIYLIRTLTPQSFKTYSFILFNCAIIDLIENFTDFLVMLRLAPLQPMLIYIPKGPCGLISANFCFITHCVTLHAIIHSMMLVAISFWYRYVILMDRAPSIKRLAKIIAIVYVPSFVVSAGFTTGITEESAVRAHYSTFYPADNVTNMVMTGQASMLFPPIAIGIAYYAFAPTCANIFIVLMRRKAMACLAENAFRMSPKTRKNHARLLRALTLHALAPLFTVAGATTAFLTMIGLIPPSKARESFTFFAGSIPPAINPFLTIYYVAPYRKFVTNKFGRSVYTVSTGGVTTIASAPKAKSSSQ